MDVLLLAPIFSCKCNVNLVVNLVVNGTKLFWNQQMLDVYNQSFKSAIVLRTTLEDQSKWAKILSEK